MASGFCSLGLTVTSLFSSHALARRVVLPTLRWRSSSSMSPPLRISRAATVPMSSSSFTWDDVFETGLTEFTPHNSSDLSGFLEKVHRCNRGSEKLAEFIPFVMEEQIVGYIHKGFIRPESSGYLELYRRLRNGDCS